MLLRTRKLCVAIAFLFAVAPVGATGSPPLTDQDTGGQLTAQQRPGQTARPAPASNAALPAASRFRVLELENEGRLLDALAENERLLVMNPDDRDAYVDSARLAGLIGAHSVAASRVDQRPEWFSAALRERIEQDAAAQLIRQGEIARDVQTPAHRFDVSDQALATNLNLPDESSIRTRFDRVVVLTQRESYKEAIALFNQLTDENPAQVPPYVKAAAADAHLALHEPRRAADLYSQAIDQFQGSQSWDWRVSLAYAQMEIEQPERSLDTIDTLHNEVQKTLDKSPDASADPAVRGWSERVGVLKANFDRFARRFDDSDNQLKTRLDDTPFDMDLRAARSSLLLERQQPRLSLASATRLRIDHPDSIWPRVVETEALLELTDHVATHAAIDDLRTTYGEHPQVLRLQKQFNRKNAGTVRFSLAGGASIGSHDAINANPNPIRETRTEAQIESRLLDDRFRVLGGYLLQSAELPEGHVLRRRASMGLGLELPDLQASASLTGDPTRGEVGANGRLNYTLNDTWRIGATAARNSDDVPLRAVRAGVRLDNAGVELQWRRQNTTSITAGVDAGRFSDGNRREYGWLAWRQLWVDRLDKSLSSRVSLSTMTFSDQNVAYFAPKRYSSIGVALIAKQQLYRNYDTSWNHQLTIEPTYNQQAGTRSAAGVNLRYEHLFEIDANWGGRAAVDYIRRPYDGIQEARWVASIELFKRF